MPCPRSTQSGFATVGVATIVWAILGSFTVLPTGDVDTAAQQVVDQAAQPVDEGYLVGDDELRALQRQYRGLIRLCYTRASRVPGALLPRRATVELQIADGGQVAAAEVKTRHDELARCLRRAVQQFRFPSEACAQRVTFPIIVPR